MQLLRNLPRVEIATFAKFAPSGNCNERKELEMSKYEKKRNRLTNVYLAIVITTAVLVMALSACSPNGGGGTGGTGTGDSDEMSLDEIVEALYKDVDVPAYEIIPLDKTNFEGFAFTPYSEDYQAVAADALVNITAHSVVVIKTDKSNGLDLATEIASKADPNKWLCVGSEVVDVAYTDNYVVLIMSYKDIADEILDNFKTLAPKLDGMEMQYFSENNSRFEE